MESIRVGYSRKVSPGRYESVGIEGSLEFKPVTDNIQEEFEGNLLVLKLIVDGALAKETPLTGGSLDSDPEPDLGEDPDWVKENKAKAAAEASGQVEDDGLPEMEGTETTTTKKAPPPPPRANSVQAESEEKPKPKKEVSVEGDNVYLEKAKVFRSEMKRAKTNSVYAELRIGHEDLVAHINDQYVTVRVFDPERRDAVGTLKKMKDEDTGEITDVSQMNIKEGDFVNVWGTFNPWKTDPSKFDIIAEAVEKT